MSRKHSCAAVLAGAIAVSLGSGVLSPAAHAADLRGTEFWLFFFPNELQPRDEEPRDIGLRHVYVTADADATGTLWTADPRGDPSACPTARTSRWRPGRRR